MKMCHGNTLVCKRIKKLLYTKGELNQRYPMWMDNTAPRYVVYILKLSVLDTGYFLKNLLVREAPEVTKQYSLLHNSITTW